MAPRKVRIDHADTLLNCGASCGAWISEVSKAVIIYIQDLRFFDCETVCTGMCSVAHEQNPAPVSGLHLKGLLKILSTDDSDDRVRCVIRNTKLWHRDGTKDGHTLHNDGLMVSALSQGLGFVRTKRMGILPHEKFRRHVFGWSI